MKILNIEQGTPDWHAWRKTVLTGTDCPVILGSSPWTTPYQLWQRKLSLIPEQEVNEAMRKGTDLEPEARRAYIMSSGMNFKPVCVQSTEHNFLGASLDGFNTEHGIVLEIKCGGIESHQLAMEGFIPQHYIDQMQKLLFVTGASKGVYWHYFEGHGVHIDVLPDPSFSDRYLPKAKEFWRCLAFFEPPALTNRDYVDKEKDYEFCVAADWYKELHKEKEMLEKRIELYRQVLIKEADGNSCRGNGVKIARVTTKGRVEYDKIPELQELDLDKYRKQPTESYRIMLEKE